VLLLSEVYVVRLSQVVGLDVGLIYSYTLQKVFKTYIPTVLNFTSSFLDIATMPTLWKLSMAHRTEDRRFLWEVSKLSHHMVRQI
jgi:hypothetical protein